MLTEQTRPPVTLIGPQRRPTLDAVLTSLGLRGRRIGIINAGWREREPEDGLLSDLAGGDTVNVRLWHRMQAVWEADPEFAEADRHRREVLEETQELYLRGLDHAMTAIKELLDHQPRHPRAQETAIADAEQIIRDMDTRHLSRVAETYHRFWERWPPHERPAIAHGRDLVEQELADVAAIVIPGGHVGVLAGAMHLFNVAPQLRAPVIAWGAGAMVLTDRIVLFHDRAAHGPAVAEVFSSGIGLVHDVVALPGARDRLDLADRRRMSILARRFDPARCLLLEPGTRVDIGPEGDLPVGAPVIGADGTLSPWSPA